MKTVQGKIMELADQIRDDKIILNGLGKFPKKLIILLPGDKTREYELRKTAKGKYLLN